MFITFDIGGSSIKYGVVTNKGEIIHQSFIPTKDDKEAFLNSLLKVIKDYRQDYKIEGIGISAPGIIRRDGLMITAGAIKTLYGENIQSFIEKNTGLTVSVDNDANAAAIAEKWLGNAKKMENYICLVLGTGVGGGLVINGQVYSGAHGMAGEIGWGIMRNLPEDLETSIEESSLNRRAAIVGGLCQNYNLHMNNETNLSDPRELFQLEKEGDQVAHLVLDEFFTDLSIGLLNIMSFFDPEAILVGGGISQNQEFQERLQEKLNKMKRRHESLHRIMPVIDIPVIMAELKNNAGMLGAAYQIKQKVEMLRK